MDVSLVQQRKIIMMNNQPTRLRLSNVSHWFGSNKVLYNINLDIKAGQIAAIVGPSGCGKSTLLRAIVGTHPPKQGKVSTFSHGVERECLSPNRDIGIVYQQYSLYEFLTAQQNVAAGLDWDKHSIPSRMNFFKYRKWRKGALEKAAHLLDRVGLGKHIDHYPSELSGGQRQRVAVAQSLIMEPRVLLLDEPFGALDEEMREELQLILLHLYQENEEAVKNGTEPPHTILIVTHELSEALYVGDVVLGLSQYWDWEPNHMSCPGATIVYNKPAPVFRPDDPKDFDIFAAQKAEIRRQISKKPHVIKFAKS